MLQFISDLYFWLGVQRAISSRLSSGGSGRNFLYRFDVDGSQNFVKKSHIGADEYDKYPGASHCDELPYLFKTGPSTNISSPSLDSKEFNVMKKMVETFTSFATTGDPNNHELDEKFDEVKSKDSFYNCLNISERGTNMMPLPEEERLKTWNEIFDKEKVDLY